MLFLGIMAGCQKTEKAAPLTTTCITLEEYDNLNDIDKKTEWFLNNGKNVCPEILFYRELNKHLVSGLTTVEPTVDGKSLPKTWKEVSSLTSGIFYEKYVTFDIDTTTKDIKDLILVDKFDANKFCYSVPLFNAIAAIEKLKDDSVIEFMYAKVDNKLKIVIKVGSHFYDYSEEPPFHG